MDRQDILELLRQYPNLELEDFSFQKFGAGLIHQTFLIEAGQKKFILQGFNSNVFKSPERIEKNLSRLYQQGNLEKLPFQLPLPIPNLAGTGLVNYKGKLYRLFDFVEGKSLQQIHDTSQAKIAAEAYALFSKWADSFSLGQFEETIPYFHRLDLRFARLEEVANSAKNLNPEEVQILDFYLNQKKLVEEYVQITAEIPMRLTHNDTKINNLIFSENLKNVAAVIDLDTIMPGYLLYDFGDLVRTVASAEEETSQVWGNQKVSLPIFEKLLEGYWQGAADFVSKKEGTSLLIGGEVMTCLMGLRFFTDHLEGNVYYHVDYPEQNLHRAKNQQILLQSLQANRSQMKKCFSMITGIQIDL